MARRKSLMQAFDADRRHAAFTLLQGKTYPFTLVQLPQTGMLHGADMHENIIAAGIGGNEAVTLAGIEPLDDAGKRLLLRSVVFLRRFHFDTFHAGLVPGVGSFLHRPIQPTAAS